VWFSLAVMDNPIAKSVREAPVASCTIAIGAPGSGKTHLLTERFRFLVEAGHNPDTLLIVTPTRAQASSLRDHVGIDLDHTTHGARVRSLSALAFSLVAEHHQAVSRPAPDLMKASQIDYDIAQLLEGHLEDGSGPLWPEPLGETVRGTRVFRTELREWMARLGESGGLPAEDDPTSGLHRRAEWVAASEFREEFLTVMASARPGAFDSGDIMARAIEVIQSGLPPRFASITHVGVDDAHDLTRAGLDVLLALSHQGVGITVMSEPDVAGNTFRGSEPAGHAYLASSWGVQPVVLPEVYRHGPQLRACVQEITGRIGSAGAGTQRKTPSRGPAGEVFTLIAGSAQGEAANIARLIRRAQLEQQLSPDRIAVIARRGARVSTLVRELTLAGIPARHSAVGAALRDQPAAKELVEIVAIGRGVSPLTSHAAVSLLTGLYGGMTQQELRRLRFAMRSQAPQDEQYRPVDHLLADALSAPGGFAMVGGAEASRAQQMALVLAGIRDAPSGTPVAELLWQVWEGSGARKTWAQRASSSSKRAGSAHRALDAVVALFRQAADFTEGAPGAQPELFLESVLSADVPDDVIMPTPSWPAVLVATPPGVAGQEFDLVIVSGVEDGVWPDLRLRGSLLAAHRLPAALRGESTDTLDERKIVQDDELRLFALAISRATQTLIVTATRSEEAEPGPLFDLIARHAQALEPRHQPALSLRSVVGTLRRQLVDAVAKGQPTEVYAKDLALAASWRIAGADPTSWWGLDPPSTTRALYEGADIPVSPSALAALEESPLDWFLSSVARNDSSPSSGLGVLIHQAWDSHQDGEASQMWAAVDGRFAELEYEAGWIEAHQRRLAKTMVEALAQYTRDRVVAGASVLASEARFEIRHDRVVMRGVIDRLERARGGNVLVVDLKTGQHVTDAAVVDNPQMLAYQLGLESAEMSEALGEGELISAGAVLVFVKSGVRGKAYRLASQEPLSETSRQKFLARVDTAAQIIAAAEFGGQPRSFGPPGTPGRHRWHVIAQVCGDD